MADELTSSLGKPSPLPFKVSASACTRVLVSASCLAYLRIVFRSCPASVVNVCTINSPWHISRMPVGRSKVTTTKLAYAISNIANARGWGLSAVLWLHMSPDYLISVHDILKSIN